MEGGPVSFQQSLPICCTLAALGGVLEVGATAVTAVPSVRDVQGRKLRPWLHWLALAGNVSLQLTGSLMSHLVATWFGPVSIVVPFFYSATLLSNMFIFGVLLGLEFFDKTMRVGTYVIVVAVILLPVVGPTAQDDQHINELLLDHWYALLWFGLLLLAMFITGVMLVLDITKICSTSNQRTAVLLITRASSIAVNLTVSRAFILGPAHWLFVTCLVLKILSGAIYTYAIVVQSTAVDQARFVPLNTTTIIVTNALTGIIIWEDWKVMESWYGYSCVFVLLGLGCNLLLSIPLLNEDNPVFGVQVVHKRASMLLKPQQGYRRMPSAALESLDEDDDFEGDGNEDEKDDEEGGLAPGIESPLRSDGNQHMTRREAWKLIADDMRRSQRNVEPISPPRSITPQSVKIPIVASATVSALSAGGANVLSSVAKTLKVSRGMRPGGAKDTAGDGEKHANERRYPIQETGQKFASEVTSLTNKGVHLVKDVASTVSGKKSKKRTQKENSR